MKLNSEGMTEFLYLPAEEAERTLEALKQAEQTNDIEALKWCARRLVWLDDTAQIGNGDDSFYPSRFFNKDWKKEIEDDLIPDSIKDIIARIDQEDNPKPPTVADAEKALDVVKDFFQENIPHKAIAAALSSVDAMRDAVKTAGAGK